MELKQLRSYAAVVQCGSFTKAAEKLYLSQPTVSAHVQALEEELGKRLIVRTTKSLELTPKGEAVYRRAVNILELQQQIVELCSERHGPRVIRLGASTIPSAYILPQLLPEFGRLYPEVYFTVHQSNSQGVADGLVNGLFDVGFTGAKGDDRLTYLPFCEDRIVLIAPVAEPYLSLHQRPEVPLEELLAQPIILREQSSGSQKTAARFLEHLGVEEDQLHVTARINDQEAVKNLVAGGLGVSLISERAARNFTEEKRVLQFSLPDCDTRNLYLAYRRDDMLQSHVKEFFRFVQNKFIGA